MDKALEGHINAWTVNGGIATVASVSSTAADDGNEGDQRNENIRQINGIRLDVDQLNKTVSDLVAKLRENKLIQEA